MGKLITFNASRRERLEKDLPERSWLSEFEPLLAELAEDYSLSIASNLNELQNALCASPPSLILCTWSFPFGEWRNVIEVMNKTRMQTIPVIVLLNREEALKRKATEAWREVVYGGGFDLLTEPFEAIAAQWAVRQAIESQSHSRSDSL